MALVLKHEPQGIDQIVDQLQRDLFQDLIESGWRNYECFGRAYRNRKKESIIPEVSIGQNDYLEVLFDDRFNVSSFCILDDQRVYDSKKNSFTADLSVVFQGRLDKLYPDTIGRADEKMVREIESSFRNIFWIRRLKNIVTGVDRVYEGLRIPLEKAYKDDMGSFFVCRFNFSIIWTETNCHINLL